MGVNPNLVYEDFIDQKIKIWKENQNKEIDYNH